jgi:Asp-tRNA(Asn)/Glu-tRNA(Gln) amidotransferase A subunit family amidase
MQQFHRGEPYERRRHRLSTRQKGVSNSPVTGITHNPWKHRFSAGGASSGAGSIRLPAHFNGVVGLKPTHGRIPNWPMSNNDLATYMGPITRTVTDAALMLEAMAGPHPWDDTSLEAAPQDYAAGLSRACAGRTRRRHPGGRRREGIRGDGRFSRAGDAGLGGPRASS